MIITTKRLAEAGEQLASEFPTATAFLGRVRVDRIAWDMANSRY